MEDYTVLPGQSRSVAAVVVTYNSGEVLPGLLDSLSEGLAGVESFEVIVVDNASRDESVAIAEAHPIGARIIQTGRNAGYSAAINIACATVSPETFVLVLNPDIRLFPGVASGLVDRLVADPSIGIVVPKIVGTDQHLSKSLRREPSLVTAWADALFGTRIAAALGLGEIVADASLYRRGGPVDWATGAILMIAPRARVEVGPWDESFFLYSEEVDYCARMRRAGFAIRFVPETVCVHIGGAYQENPALSALMTTNRIKYFRRTHGPLATQLFRWSIVVGETMRMHLNPGHRAALKAAVEASRLV